MKSYGIPRLQLDNGCYLYGDFGRGGTYGHLDPVFENTHGMTQSQISDFIRGSRPDLFQELGGLPFSSTDVQGFSLVVPKPSYPSSNKPSAIPRLIKPRRRGNFDLNRPLKLISHPCNPLDGVLLMLESQHKRQIQLRVLNGDQLVLRKRADPRVTVSCSDPGCAELGARLPAGNFYLTLARSYPVSGCESSKREETHYNLTCLEAIFDRPLISSEPYDFDGQSDGAVDKPTMFPYHFPSNSPEALTLRKRRYAEIEEILEEAQAQRLKSPTAQQRRDVVDDSPDLKLIRGNNISPYEQRYKKQGLQYNRRQSRTSDIVARHVSPPPRLPQTPVTGREELICVCREPGNDDETVTCSSEACLIGTFHVRCLNLEQPLEEGHEVYCMYCAEDLHEYDTDGPDVRLWNAATLVRGTGVAHEEHNSPIDSSSTIDGEDGGNSSEAGRQSTEEQAEEDPDCPLRHSFTAINGPNAGTNVSLATPFDGPSFPTPATPCLKPISSSSLGNQHKTQPKQYPISLPPGSSSMTFIDLAPFITISSRAQTIGWTKEEIAAFKQWKSACPKSRLLAGLAVKQITRQSLRPMATKSLIRLNEFRAVYCASPFKLSELLKNVSDGLVAI